MSIIIKKEEIKKDIVINFGGNFIYGVDIPLISMVDGELVINIVDCRIFKEGILENYTLKKEYIDRFNI